MVKTTKSRKAVGVRRARGSISAEEILTGAFEIADARSLGHLSMSVLAEHLDVGVASMYWYFRRKDDLLDAMTEQVTAEYFAAVPAFRAQDWAEVLRRHFRRMRAIFAERPVLVELVLLRPGSGQLQFMSAAADTLKEIVDGMVDAGFTAQGAFEVYMSLLAHTCGSAMTEHQGVFSGRASTGPRSNPASAPSASFFDELGDDGHDVTDIENAMFEFTLDAILERAEAMIGRSA